MPIIFDYLGLLLAALALALVLFIGLRKIQIL
uniref:Cytochrome b6-f complex subunit 6 n=1 Tax=Selaginella uncinata TaxID=307165 RepID=A0A0G2UFC4_SELUN|nr:cytochrome b6/f complex subunit VI [Selaginella uncinata]